jgi:hypothetical protein
MNGPASFSFLPYFLPSLPLSLLLPLSISENKENPPVLAFSSLVLALCTPNSCGCVNNAVILPKTAYNKILDIKIYFKKHLKH